VKEKIVARWLDPERAADYLSVRVDQLSRMLKAGLIPKPHYMLGPRKPRYDRLELDAMTNDSSSSIDAAFQEAIENGATDTRRQAEARRRNGEGLHVSANSQSTRARH
jgi:hypothetical protein